MAVRELDSQPTELAVDEVAQRGLLTARALELLQVAASKPSPDAESAFGERSVWEPDSWLMQSCWQTLADQGAGEQALAAAAKQETRNPLARAQALYRLSKRAKAQPYVRSFIVRELRSMHTRLFGEYDVSHATQQSERLLLAAGAAVNIQSESLALACLERLDQIDRGWDRVILRADSRGLLAESIAAVGVHPLVNYLISTSIRRHEEAGAQFLHDVIMRLRPAAGESLPLRSTRLLGRCVQTFQFALLSSLNSRRLAAIVFGQAGMISDMLAQMTTMANVQEARRETGVTSRLTDPHFLRQVTRPNANPDVDYQLYTLQEAISAMPLRQISREERILLADRVAELAVQSDGWTAAGATATLVTLGALRYAVEVVDYISPTDPTRSEGVISLVRALLEIGEDEQARLQVDKALEWLKSNGGQNAQRAAIWGVAEALIEHGKPDQAIYLLSQRREAPSFGSRMRRWVRPGWTDDMLRDNRLRLRALLSSDAGWTAELQELYGQLTRWAPALLEGEALISFYLDGLMAPLLESGKHDQVIALLPALANALKNSSGEKHAVNIQKMSDLLLSMFNGPVVQRVEQTGVNGAEEMALTTSDAEKATEAYRTAAKEFLETIWAEDAKRGLWQIVRGLEGGMSLLHALEGPQALASIADAAASIGAQRAQE